MKNTTMTNKEIANAFNELAALMELHKENSYKIRSYAFAYNNLRKLADPLTEMSEEEIGKIKGIGKAITSKIQELIQNGSMENLEKCRAKTPKGIREMIGIKGLGPKKIRVLWEDLGAESVGEVLYACNENRLIELKGFGEKTQADLKKKLEYFLLSKNKFHYASLESHANILLDYLQTKVVDGSVYLTGKMIRRMPEVEAIEMLIATDQKIDAIFDGENLSLETQKENYYTGKNADGYPVIIYHCTKNELGSKTFRYASSPEFIKHFLQEAKAKDFKEIPSEEMVFEKAGLPFVQPELREPLHLDVIFKKQFNLVEATDVKGVLHVHSTYSDGIHSLEDMVTYAREQGYAYIGITDHSKSAFYANGLKPDRVLQQFGEIDALNKKMGDDFHIFKGIESDILSTGELDYEKELLEKFDFIIASVHSNLKMDKDKATTRLLKAIENPYTTILGHPTGRLLLSREGYPIDHKKIIDACAANNVAIELNANPYRLDLDWQHIPYAVSKGVKIAINPDAHSKAGIHDIHFGVLAARKGGLEKDMCLNTLDKKAFAAFVENK